MTIELRPHHLLDIVRDYGHGIVYQPHAYGHALHLVAAEVLARPDQEIIFVIAADSICRPCRNLRSDGSCADILSQLAEPISKQSYNDALDRRLWAYLELDRGNRLRVRQFLERVNQRLAGLEKVCSHPGEDEAFRRDGMQKGLARLGIG